MDRRGSGRLSRRPLRTAGRTRPRPAGPARPDGIADLRGARPPGEPDRPRRSRAPWRSGRSRWRSSSADAAAAIVGILAAYKAGKIALHLDPTLPPERLRFFLEDSGAGLLVSAGALLPLARMLDVGRRDSAPRPRGRGRRGGLRRAARPLRAGRRSGLHPLHVRFDGPSERRRLQPPGSALELPREHAAKPRDRARPDPPRRLAGERPGSHDAPGPSERCGPLPVRHRDRGPPGAPGLDP